VSNRHAIAFDTGDPLEGYGAEPADSHERSQPCPQSRDRDRDARPGCARQAGRTASTGRGGVDVDRPLTRTQAKRRSISATRLVADVLRSNHRMQHLARAYGLAIAEL
jgi:hypothetical protein